MSSIGERIKELRKKEELTQKGVCSKNTCITFLHKWN